MQTSTFTFISDLDSPSFWRRRLEILELRRCRYTKVGAWTATIVSYVNELDEQIKECTEMINALDHD